MKLFRAGVTGAVVVAIGAMSSYADPAPTIHYAPAENLEHVDVALIDSAQHEIDFPAYGTGLSFKHSHARPIVASKCVFISMPVDCEKPRDRRLSKLWPKTPSVEIRVKQESSALMHLKSYQVDGHVLRTGAANFSASGLKREDDDLNVIESVEAAMAFKRNFEARFASGDDFLAERK